MALNIKIQCFSPKGVNTLTNSLTDIDKFFFKIFLNKINKIKSFLQ